MKTAKKSKYLFFLLSGLIERAIFMDDFAFKHCCPY